MWTHDVSIAVLHCIRQMDTGPTISKFKIAVKFTFPPEENYFWFERKFWRRKLKIVTQKETIHRWGRWAGKSHCLCGLTEMDLEWRQNHQWKIIFRWDFLNPNPSIWFTRWQVIMNSCQNWGLIYEVQAYDAGQSMKWGQFLEMFMWNYIICDLANRINYLGPSPM